jgi:hypothetical protein
MTDPGADNPIARIMRSDLPDDVKAEVIRRLAVEHTAADRRISELTDKLLADLAEGQPRPSIDELIAEIEEHLRDQ